MKRFFWTIALLCSVLFLPTNAHAQVTRADYERAAGLRKKYDGLAVNIVDRPTWIGKTNRFVRSVDKVDEQKRQIWFQASGMYSGKDPYFVHSYRINFDGSGLTPLTETDANHTIAFSDDMKYYVDT